VATTYGGDPANPEDCADGPGTQCYVTANSLPGGSADMSDVDAIPMDLHSPHIDLTGYKRSRLAFDLWYYDSTPGDPNSDRGEYGWMVDDPARPYPIADSGWLYEQTEGWVPVEKKLTVPLVNWVRVTFQARDNSPDDVVEMGVDNVEVLGELQACDPPGAANAPNGVGDTVRAAKSAGSCEFSWQASPVDGSHDGAAYYEMYGSGSPEAGFTVDDTTTVTAASIPLSGDSRYVLVTAVNAAGTSGDEPLP
jgi:hypothetical protein